MSREGSGLTPRDQQILDLDEAGLDPRAIGAVVRAPVALVRACIARNAAIGGGFDEIDGLTPDTLALLTPEMHLSWELGR